MHDALRTLETVNAPVLGTVVNGAAAGHDTYGYTFDDPSDGPGVGRKGRKAGKRPARGRGAQVEAPDA